MNTQPTQQTEALLSRIGELEQRLHQLLSEPAVMYDEINAVQRDLQALRCQLAEV